MDKHKYLDILGTGVFATFSPGRLDALHGEVARFLATADPLEPAELFDVYELQFFVLLLTNRDIEAKSYLDRFNDQFGNTQSQKIMILRLMYYEATGDMKSAIAALGNNPDEVRALRRLATFSRTKADGSKNWPEYAKSLNYYLNLQPADVEAWAELASVYAELGHYKKAVFCAREVVLLRPTAYNAFYTCGRYNYLLFLQSERAQEALDALELARDAFLRAVEISESCTEAWLGLSLLSVAKLADKKAAARVSKLAADFEKIGALAKKMVMKYDHLDEEQFDALLKSRSN